LIVWARRFISPYGTGGFPVSLRKRRLRQPVLLGAARPAARVVRGRRRGGIDFHQYPEVTLTGFVNALLLDREPRFASLVL
jgi:hypothetical protein